MGGAARNNLIENKRKLIRSLSVLLLSVVMLAGVTIAWFVNNTSPFLEKLNLMSPDLNVSVNITGEEGKTAVDDSGNAILLAEYMKPGDSVDYTVEIRNNGTSPCKVFLGIDKVKDYDLGGTQPLADGSVKLSDCIRLSLYEGGNPSELEAMFLGGVTSAYFKSSARLKSGETKTFLYKVEFVGNPKQAGEAPTGAIPDNTYTEKRMEASFAVTSTLAD